MSSIERGEYQPGDPFLRPLWRSEKGLWVEILHPGDFYVAYIFDQAASREADVSQVITQAQELGYPLRYWWLSQAMDLMGSTDRLIVCVHHPGGSSEAGMDPYHALHDGGVTWDDVEAAAMDEYMWLGAPIQSLADLAQTNGAPLVPPPSAS